MGMLFPPGCTRLLEGVLIGLIFGLLIALFSSIKSELQSTPADLSYPVLWGLLAGVVGGLAMCLTDLWRLRGQGIWARINAASRWRQLTIYISMTGTIVALALLIPAWVVLGYANDGLTTLLYLGIWVAITASFFALVLGTQNAGRTLASDIRSVETLGFSWHDAWPGGLKGFAGGAFFGWCGWVYLWGHLNHGSEGLTMGAMVGGIGCLIGMAFDGFKSQVMEQKAVPNQGIKLSLRNGIVYGGGVGLMTGFLFGLIIYWMITSNGGAESDSFMAGVKAGIEAGVLIGLLGIFWYGGLEFIRHYTLRLILYFKGYTPFDYAGFLDYAAERLVFLEKVGCGYMFIHRYLLEHFTDLDREIEVESGEEVGS